MQRCILLILFIGLFIFKAFSQLEKTHGIIIADETEQIKLFNSDSATVIKFADSIAAKYSKVIIHLGRNYVFRKGNIYSSEKSQENLRNFCSRLKNSHVKIYLWQLDSYGGEPFLNIYNEHREIIKENMAIIESHGIYYDGIVVDLEWINVCGFDNSGHFNEVIKYFRERIGNKELMYFVSLIDCDETNKKRGYYTNHLASFNAVPVIMLYPTNGGYYIEGNKLLPNMNDQRIKELMRFHKKNNWEIAIYLDYNYCVNIDNKVVELEKTSVEHDSVFLKVNPQKMHDYRNYQVLDYRVDGTCKALSTDGKIVALTNDMLIYKFQMKKEILKKDNYIYEYFNLKKSHLNE